MSAFVLSCAQDELVGGTNLSSVSMESTERRQFVTEIQALSKLVATECMLIVILGISVRRKEWPWMSLGLNVALTDVHQPDSGTCFRFSMEILGDGKERKSL